MVSDILIALVITVIAIVLGIAVHPLLFFLVVFAILWLVMRRRSGSRV